MFAHLIKFKCLLGVMRKLGSYMASIIAWCRHFLRLLYLFITYLLHLLITLCLLYLYYYLWKKHLFSFTLTHFMSLHFNKIWVKPNVIYSYLHWKYLRTPGCSQSRLIAQWPTLPQEDIIANFLLYSVANTGLADTVF